MSLEDKISALVAALQENTDVQKAVLATIQGAKAGGTAPADKDTDKEADKPKATRAARGSAKAAKPPSVKEIQDKTLAWIDVDDDAEYEERAALVVQIADHFGVKKMSEIGDDDRALAMQMLDAAIAGDDPFEGIAPKEEAKPSRRSLA